MRGKGTGRRLTSHDPGFVFPSKSIQSPSRKSEHALVWSLWHMQLREYPVVSQSQRGHTETDTKQIGCPHERPTIDEPLTGGASSQSSRGQEELGMQLRVDPRLSASILISPFSPSLASALHATPHGILRAAPRMDTLEV